MLLRLVERGPVVPLPTDDVGNALRLDPHFQKLRAAGILRLVTIGSTYGLQASKYVGRATLRFGSIEVVPRRPPLFTEIAQLATAFSIRKHGGTSLGAEEQGQASIHDVLLRDWNEAICDGLPIEYVNVRNVGSSLRGRLMMSETITRFASKGIGHKAVTRVRKPRIIPEVLGLIGTVLDLLDLRYDLTQRQRIVLDALCSTVNAPKPRPLPEALSICSNLEANYLEWPNLIRAVSTSRLFLMGEEIALTDRIETESGRSTFSDMDRLWEQAVFSMANIAAQPYALRSEFHPLAGSKRLLLRDGERQIDPDMMLFGVNGDCAVVDAKYSSATAADSSDIYQMLAYCRTLGARLGVMVYLSDYDWTERIGSDEVTTLFAVGLSQTGSGSLQQSGTAALTGILQSAMDN